jgi:hypothetical protein
MSGFITTVDVGSSKPVAGLRLLRTINLFQVPAAIRSHARNGRKRQT